MFQQIKGWRHCVLASTAGQVARDVFFSRLCVWVGISNEAYMLLNGMGAELVFLHGVIILFCMMQCRQHTDIMCPVWGSSVAAKPGDQEDHKNER
jgi:hypothetical protein